MEESLEVSFEPSAFLSFGEVAEDGFGAFVGDAFVDEVFADLVSDAASFSAVVGIEDLFDGFEDFAEATSLGDLAELFFALFVEGLDVVNSGVELLLEAGGLEAFVFFASAERFEGDGAVEDAELFETGDPLDGTAARFFVGGVEFFEGFDDLAEGDPAIGEVETSAFDILGSHQADREARRRVSGDVVDDLVAGSGGVHDQVYGGFEVAFGEGANSFVDFVERMGEIGQT